MKGGSVKRAKREDSVESVRKRGGRRMREKRGERWRRRGLQEERSRAQ